MRFHRTFWPGSVLADYQVEILQSIERNKITVVPAGNKLGKDYIAAFAGLHFFCSRRPARVITTSVDGSQLQGVLWGEIRNFIQTAAFPLPVHVNHLHLRQKLPDGSLVGNSEMIGRVVSKGEGLLGRHLPYGPNMEPHVLAIIDEASGFEDANYMGIDTWAHRILIIGNPFPCENFFKRLVEQGDQKSESPYLDHDVKVIKIPAIKSPNVQLSLAEERAGKPLSRRIIVPGCMDIDDYRWRCKTYDPVKKAAGIDAEFYEGDEVRMFPQEWLRESQDLAVQYRNDPTLIRPQRRAIGIDTAEGGDNTVWTVVDRLGVLAQVSKKTHNTAVIKGMTIGLIKEYNVNPEDVLFDRGGGGKEHADYLRMQGYEVDSVGFGEGPSAPDEFEFGFTMPEERKEMKEERYTYKNKRVQLYHILRQLLNPPDPNTPRFAIPPELTELLRQLKPIPVLYDGEGRMYLPPKDKPTENYQGTTIKEMLGCSPDESDSTVLATYAISKPPMPVVGAF